MELPAYKCQVCGIVLTSLDNFIVHLKFQHGFNRGCNSYKCMNDNCYRTFQSVYVYKRHLKRCYMQNETGGTTKIVSALSSDLGPVNNEIIQMTDNLSPGSARICSEPPLKRLKESATLMCANLYSDPSFPNNLVQKVIDQATTFIKEGYLPLLEEVYGTNLEPPNEQVNSKLQILQDPFSHLSSHYLRIKHFKDSSMYAPPVSYVIGESLKKKVDNNAAVIVESVASTAQYIPLTYTLTQLLNTPGTLQSMRTNVSSLCQYGELKVSVLQGDLWKSKLKTFQSNYGTKEVYPLIMYFDDFETGNPLGSHAGSQKLGAIYYTCPALPPHLISKLDYIHVAALFKTKDRYIYGNEPILRPLISEIQKLECEGLTITNSGEQLTVHFILLALVGDNLGLHSMLGFVESFSANNCCRFCKASKVQTRQLVTEVPSLYRLISEYDVGPNYEFDRSDTFIKEYCYWNDLKSFHCYTNFVVDPMHDLLEGVCRYEMSQIVHYFISVKVVTLITINNRMLFFDYGVDSGSIPPPIKSEHLKKGCIIMSASEMCTLMKYFPLIIGDLIPQDNEVWSLFLILRNIVEFVLLDTLPPGSSQYLKSLVRSHHQRYLSIFKTPLKPKHHFLTHYPKVIDYMGPFKQFWCMRFEGKHRQMKRYVTSIACHKNIPLSLATKCQLQMCYNLISNTPNDLGIPNDSFTFGPAKKNLKNNQLLISNENLENLRFPLKSFAWAEIRGIKFKPGQAIVVRINEGEPQFGKILHITTAKDNRVCFIVDNYTNICFDVHLASFEVTSQNSHSTYILPSNFNRRPVNIVHANDGGYYIPRWE